MKKILILLLGVVLVAPGYARALKVDSLLDGNVVGLRAGINFPSMYYSNANLQDYKNSIFLRPIFGAFFEKNLTNNLSLRPELVFVGKGQKINDLGVSYQIASNYLELRVPVLYTYKKLKSLQPYLMLGPTVGVATGGKILFDTYKVNVNKSNMASTDFGVIGGLGIKIPVLIKNLVFVAAGEVNYALGLSNTFAPNEKDATATALNRDTYSINGNRQNRGLGFSVLLGFPLRNLQAKKEHKEPIPVIVKQLEKDSVSQAPEPVISPVPEKSCYTIDEMISYLKQGYNVADKKICMYNLKFETGRSVLDAASVAYLSRLIDLLNVYHSIKLRINGHTDNVGSEQYNLKLSKQRALSVYSYLIDNGIAKNRLTYTFYGTRDPISTNNTEEGRALNRRVEFEIKY